jgi:hypothetical protein
MGLRAGAAGRRRGQERPPTARLGLVVGGEREHAAAQAPGDVHAADAVGVAGVGDERDAAARDCGRPHAVAADLARFADEDGQVGVGVAAVVAVGHEVAEELARLPLPQVVGRVVGQGRARDVLPHQLGDLVQRRGGRRPEGPGQVREDRAAVARRAGGDRGGARVVGLPARGGERAERDGGDGQRAADHERGADGEHAAALSSSRWLHRRSAFPAHRGDSR